MSKWTARRMNDDHGDGDPGWYVYDDDHEESGYICDLHSYDETDDCVHDYQDAQRNARLIAAAPEMLEMIKALVEEINDTSAMVSNIYNAEQLITKIEGENNGLPK